MISRYARNKFFAGNFTFNAVFFWGPKVLVPKAQFFSTDSANSVFIVFITVRRSFKKPSERRKLRKILGKIKIKLNCRFNFS